MDFILESLKKAFALIFSLDAELLRISWRSIWIATTSTCLATAVGLPLALLVTFKDFRGRQVLTTILNTLMALPTVVVGLLVYAFICRRGLFGDLALLYTPWAMVIGQFILATPIIAAISVSAMKEADTRITTTARTLGATPLQTLATLAGEMRISILAAVIAGFGRVFAEVGVSMMLGGNIRHYTRNITTAIAFETSRGEFSLALALGMILLSVALAINILFQCFMRAGRGLRASAATESG
jgi:tungstate transport system permease protein